MADTPDTASISIEDVLTDEERRALDEQRADPDEDDEDE